MTARNRILTAVRRGLGGTRRPPAAIAAQAAMLLDDPEFIRPALVATTLPEAFELKAAVLGTTVERVASMDQMSGSVRRYLAAHALPPSLALQQSRDLTGLDWSGIETHASIAPDEVAALGIAVRGIAESGSLVIRSGADKPILLSFLPLHHIVVLRADTLVAHLDDYAAIMQGEAQPRNAILITGPSGTTDIEGSYVRGAHGPGFLHVVMVGS
ncbi:LUD domain-containing protein [uncultured Paracoccus sp.]|uniref:LutC/YkgG family protein n=1 Tax=uncultured Paracoccus sp. TaxID=189685 RepID=UPI002629C29A|nr:LUD domain-containing protein [uncultured Paracoccus sp.]